MSKKTNIQHLRDLIKDNDEACEFLDAIENELEDANAETTDLEDEVKKLELRNSELSTEITELQEEKELSNIIKTPIGNIQWEANNLQHIAIFEALAEKVKYMSPLKIEAAIKSL